MNVCSSDEENLRYCKDVKYSIFRLALMILTKFSQRTLFDSYFIEEFWNFTTKK